MKINAAMKACFKQNLSDTTTDEIVSSDIVGMRYGSLFDATQTMVLPLDNGLQQRYRLFLGMTTKTLTQARW